MAVAQAETTEINYPKWTEYRKKNGVDPLGVQNTGIGLHRTLLPGTSNLTLRMCNYGFYVWLSRIDAQRIGSTTPITWCPGGVDKDVHAPACAGVGQL